MELTSIFISFFPPDNSEVSQWARERKIPSIQHDALLGVFFFTLKFQELNTNRTISIVTDGNDGPVLFYLK